MLKRPDETTSKTSGAFRRVPYSVIRDPRLGPAAVVLAAWRSTIVGRFEINERHLKKEPPVEAGSGLGKNNVRVAIAQLCGAGYLARHQPPSDASGKFRCVVERLTLPPCGASGKAGTVIFRRWFDGRLSLKQMAGFLYLRAGTGRGPCVFASELAKRFGWSRPTATAVLADLIKVGLVQRGTRRDAAGRVLGVSYRVPRASHMQFWPADASVPCGAGSRVPGGPGSTVKKPGIGSPGIGFSGNSLTSYPPHQQTSSDPASHTESGHCVPQSETLREEDFWDLEAQAFSDSHLLGWMGEEQSRLLNDYLDNIDYDLHEAMEEIADAVPDAKLRELIRKATSGKVHAALLSPAGLYAFRYIASFYYSTPADDRGGEDPAPAEAVAWLLTAINDRHATAGEWINSLRVVAERIIGDAYGYGAVSQRLYARSTAPGFVVR